MIGLDGMGIAKQQKRSNVLTNVFVYFQTIILLYTGYDEGRHRLKYISPFEDSCITDKLTDSCIL